MKKRSETPETEQKEIDVMSFKIDHVSQYKKTVFFDMTLNGVKIYGCTVAEGKKGDFISLPSRKASDGKWYSIVYARLSDHDQEMILTEVEEQLNA